jgi:hypothetical protein
VDKDEIGQLRAARKHVAKSAKADEGIGGTEL